MVVVRNASPPWHSLATQFVWRWFTLIVVLSALIRFAILSHCPKTEIVSGGEAENIARSLALSGRFADPYAVPSGFTAHCPPFYPLLLSMIYKLMGTGLAAGYARCTLIILAYSVLYGLKPIIARGLGLPIEVGVVAGLFSALLPLKRSAEIWRGWEDPYAALVLAGLLIWTRQIWKQAHLTFSNAALYGAAWGLSFYMIPSFAPLQLGFAAVHLCRFHRPGRARVALWWAVSAAATFLVLVPWTLRNHSRLGAWMFMRSNLGLELAVSNSDGALPSYGLNIQSGHEEQMHPLLSVQQALLVRSLGEVEFNRELLGDARSWIAAHPKGFAKLTVERFIYFWAGPFNTPWTTVGLGLMSIGGLCGLLLIRRYYGATLFWLFATLWALYPLIYYTIQYVNRYRFAMDWTIVLACSVFVIELVKRAQSRRMKISA